MAVMLIKNCYDSHVHWQGIGSFKLRLCLKHIRTLCDFKKVIFSKNYQRGHWFIGQGLDSSFFINNKTSAIELLSQLWPNNPVYITSPDIHCVYLNMFAMKELSLLSEIPSHLEPFVGKEPLNNKNWTGEFKDSAKDYIDSQLPRYTDEQVKQQLLIAQDHILQAGFTHIRDLTCSEQQMQMAIKLQDEKKLKIVADLYFKLQSYSQLQSHIELIQKLKVQQTEQLKVKGVKVFVDGALGSEGALLSEPYLSKKQGFKLYSDEQLSQIFQTCVKNNLDLAFHTIGDQASLDVLRVLEQQSTLGSIQVHLEHVQLLCDEAVALIKKHKVICHMQPQHWLSDKAWLSNKISPQLLSKQFRWGDLSEQDIPLYFGSDAPVEDMNLLHVLDCLKLSEKEGIKPVKTNLQKHLSYPGVSPLKTETYIDEKLNKATVKYLE